MISTVLLALTKVQSEGKWIESLFTLPNQIGAIKEGPDVVNVTLFDGEENNTDQGHRKSMRIDKANMTMLDQLGVSKEHITEPW